MILIIYSYRDSDQHSPLVDVDEHDEDPAPSRPPSSTKAAQCSSNSSAEEVKSDPAPPQIQAYPPPPSPSLLASIGNSLNQQQSGVTQPSGLAYPRPIHPALMLEAMNFHHRMMPDGRLPYASFLSGHHHHMMPTRYVNHCHQWMNFSCIFPLLLMAFIFLFTGALLFSHRCSMVLVPFQLSTAL